MKAQPSPGSLWPIVILICLQSAHLAYSQEVLDWGDLVITELMADPDPCAGSCHREFVEVLNRSGHAVPLDSFWLQVGSRKIYPGEKGAEEERSGNTQEDYLQPGAYMAVEGMQVSNREGKIAVWSAGGRILHWVSYAYPFDGPQWKAEGGWSLEAMDPELLCAISSQWQWSKDPSGATPGRENSVRAHLRDMQAPAYLYHGFGEDRMYLYFSEILGAPGSTLPGFVVQADGVRSSSAWLEKDKGHCVVLEFPGGLSRRPGYLVKLPALTDCEGNQMGEESFGTGLPSEALPGSLVINEIMFQPRAGHQEYIELFHAGPGHTDLAQLAVGTAAEGEIPDRHYPLSDHSRMLGKGGYVVLCRDSHALMENYDLELSGAWLELPDLPSLPSSGGKIWLFDRSGNSLDVAVFSAEMHMAGMDHTEGVSLERIRSREGGEDPSNWHPAASIEGYCTPGKANSQLASNENGESLLQLIPEVFSPGYDGYQDFQQIEIRGLKTGTILRLWITDLEGRLVSTLGNNHIVGPVSSYTWDGRDGSGRPVKPGFYVVHLEAFHLDKNRQWRQRAASGVIYP